MVQHVEGGKKIWSVNGTAVLMSCCCSVISSACRRWRLLKTKNDAISDVSQSTSAHKQAKGIFFVMNVLQVCGKSAFPRQLFGVKTTGIK